MPFHGATARRIVWPKLFGLRFWLVTFQVSGCDRVVARFHAFLLGECP